MPVQAAVGQAAQDGADAFRVFVELVDRAVQGAAHVGTAQRGVEGAVKALHGFPRGAVHVEHRVFHRRIGLGQHVQAVERFEGLLQVVECGGVHDGSRQSGNQSVKREEGGAFHSTAEPTLRASNQSMKRCTLGPV
ncbi:hypothetical protein GALL_488930 [mine drainage metagenome]|uniref:Uncharacterized protein n=1 Tax=mine drainage metagenome TaxID=410659 RepID=A0A1J5PE48_9ZZZZ